MLIYDLYYRDSFGGSDKWEELKTWDLFLSAYDRSDRVASVFNRVRATEKRWLVHKEYGFSAAEHPTDAPVYTHVQGNEADCINGLFEGSERIPLHGRSICIDITGFMRPHLMFLMRYLSYKGISYVDVLYSEPVQYKRLHKTTFAKGVVTGVRQVAGFQGQHVAASSLSDLLIIGCGYEHELIKHVAESKVGSRKMQLFCFPATQADFYQEGVLRAEGAAEAISPGENSLSVFAPAYDPFETASVLSKLGNEEKRLRKFDNIYLSPLATKPQALGFALYYLHECQNTPTSIIFPFAEQYEQDTSVGISRIWRYSVELPAAPASAVGSGP